jgi:hypothetical protein
MAKISPDSLQRHHQREADSLNRLTFVGLLQKTYVSSRSLIVPLMVVLHVCAYFLRDFRNPAGTPAFTEACPARPWIVAAAVIRSYSRQPDTAAKHNRRSVAAGRRKAIQDGVKAFSLHEIEDERGSSRGGSGTVGGSRRIMAATASARRGTPAMVTAREDGAVTLAVRGRAGSS